MTWQDRDYARPVPPPHMGRSVGGPRTWSLVTTLIVINVGVYLVRGWAPSATYPALVAARDRTDPRHVVVVEQRVAADAPFALGAMHTERVLHGQVWRLITSQYLHANGMHVFLNMLGLYFFGPPLERGWGRKTFFAVYTLAGLCGNLLLLALGVIGWINPYLPAVGASGCILGLLGACAVLFPHAEVWVYMLFPLKIRTAALIMAAGFVYNMWQQGANYGGDACHLAGLAFGAWYARWGAAWWAVRGSRLGDRLLGSRGDVTKPRSTQWQKKMDQRRADADLIDELLAKVYEGGLHSLTPSERKALTEATERARQQEQSAGRTDRL